MEPFVYALATLSLADSISFMIVTPSLAFYISSLGGSQDFYGFVLAIYSFASFCGKPILGRWSDVYSFQVPYTVSISLSVFGGFMYAIAPAFENKTTALASVALGRTFGGLGRANAALNFAYVARACPANERTSITALLGGVQMMGMAIAPLFSALVIDADFSLCGVPFDSLNSVGLLLVIFNIISQVVVYLFLPDLPTAEDDGHDKGEKESEWLRMFRCTLHDPHIAVPFLTILAFNFNWQLIETAVAPVSLDALGWGTVEVSFVLGGMAVLVFVGMISVHKLSKSGVSDFKLLCGGLSGTTIAFLMLYMLWYRGVGYAAFLLPIFLGSSSFPFLGAPNRSLFTEAVDLTPELSGFEGTMQALLSMSSSIGGFTAPYFVTHYWLRTPEEVALSNDDREFVPWALLCPLLSLSVLTATCWTGDIEKKVYEATEANDDPGPDEATPLNKKNLSRRVSDGDAPPKNRRLSLAETGRMASIRGSMFTPMTLIPPDDAIYEDDNKYCRETI